MRDFAVRLYNSKLQKMEYIKDLYFFKERGIHESGDGGIDGEYIDPVMIASPFYDIHKNRIYEKDIIEIYSAGFHPKYIKLAIVTLDSKNGWIGNPVCGGHMFTEIGERLGGPYYQFNIVGNTYLNSQLIEDTKLEYEQRIADRDNNQRERDLEKLNALKEKYMGATV